jgi:hypothetical protein
MHVPDRVGVGVLLLLTLASQWDLLTGGTFIGMDTATAFFPWYAFLGEQLRAGRIPTWNPHQFAGAPFAADPESGWMYLPAMFAFTVLPLDAAAKAYMVFHVALASLSTYALARALGCNTTGGLVAGIAYGFSGFFLGHNACCFAYSGVAAWLPLMLLGTEQAMRASDWRGRGLWWGISGLAVSQILTIWIGQGAYYSLLVLGGFIGYRTRLAARGLILHGGAILLFGFGLAAAGVIPRLEYNLLSNLPGGYPDADVTYADWSWTSWGLVADWKQRLLEPGFHYLGWTTLALALAAPVLVRHWNWRRHAVPFFVALPLAVLVLARYEPTPLHSLMSILPGFERLHARSPERSLIVLYLGPALLAGITASHLPIRERRGVKTLVAILILGAVCVDLRAAWNTQAGDSRATEGAYKLDQVDLGVYFAPTAAARFLQARAETEDRFRYFGFAQHVYGGPLPYTLRWADPKTTALEVNNRALVTGLNDIQGYNPVHLARYDEFIAALNGQPQNYHHTDIFEAGLGSPLLDMLGARYIVVSAVTSQDQTAARFERPLQSVYEDEHVRVLENPAAYPRAWLVHSAQQATLEEAKNLLASGEVDARRVALLEEPPLALAQPDDLSSDFVQIESYAADRITVRTRSSASGLVVLAEVHYPAWRAYVDGSPVRLYVANIALRAVGVPPGTHDVELRYESPALLAGVALSMVAGVALAILVLDNARSRRIGGSRCKSGAVPQL